MGLSRANAALRRAEVEARAARSAEINEVILREWPRLSALEIGSMLDVTANSVIDRAKRLGFASRPIRAKPEVSE